jgi:uncharacterized delta-60 repeat protein
MDAVMVVGAAMRRGCGRLQRGWWPRSGLSVVVVAAVMMVALKPVGAAPGLLDPSFGAGAGFTLTSFPGAHPLSGVLVTQPDGHLVVAGTTLVPTPPPDGVSSVSLARFNADGVLDPTFGTSGTVTTTGAFPLQVLAATSQSDGKIVVAAAGVTASESGVIVLRYTADGVLDTNFGTDGQVIAVVNGMGPAGIAVQPDGKIVVAASAGANMEVARLSPSGASDGSFGQGGIAMPLPSLRQVAAEAVAVDASGNIVVAGGVSNASNPFAPALIRLQPNGTLDTTFGFEGIALDGDITDGEALLDVFTDVVIDGTGRLVVSENTWPVGRVLRYLSSGERDFSWAGQTADNEVQTVTIATDGRVAAGVYGFGAVQYRADGNLDTRFGVGGYVALSVNGATNEGTGGVIYQSGDRLAVGGWVNGPTPASAGFAVSRFLQVGAPGTITDLAAAPGVNGATFTWTPPPDGGTPITGYTLSLSSPGFFDQIDTRLTSLTVAGLAANTTIAATVTATNLAGKGPSSPTTYVVPAGPAPPPSCPTARSQTVSGTPWAMAAMRAADGCAGYWVATRDGGVYAFGAAESYGSLAGHRLSAPIVAMATTPDSRGYWMLGADGGIFTFGDAAFYGSTGNLHLNAPVAGMATTPTGRGYWIVAADGGIFAFGDAAFYGSTGALHLNAAVVGITASVSGHGYRLVAADGGIFSFGDAAFYGSLGGVRLNRPVIGMSSDPATGGYRLVASDGGVFDFKADFYGSLGATALPAPITTMAPTVDGNGYYLLAANGTIYNFNAPLLGDGR